VTEFDVTSRLGLSQSHRLAVVEDPIIPVVGELVRAHPGTISLGQGVVHYGPPPESTARLNDFQSDPQNHKYKLVQGIPELLAAIEKKLADDNGIVLADAHAVMVTAGGNMAFMNAVLAVADPGDEIILQTPYYFNHEMAVAIAGCRAVCVATDEAYQLRPEAIEAAVTERTRAIVTISPNNPTGAVYPWEALAAVNQLCGERGIYHIHDEAYEYFTYGGAEHVSPGSFEGSAAHTISLFSLSKSYGFAGWRIGYMVMPENLYLACKKIQDTILICPPVVSQWAALGALEAGSAYCREHLAGIAAVRETVLNALSDIADIVTVPPADGAFYFLLRVHTDLDAMTVVERLVREYGVAVIPGGTFGIEDGCYLRVAYGALDPETVEEGVGRLVVGLRAIVGG
jgi:aspartate/methionine/tyrosine aminotransferase